MRIGKSIQNRIVDAFEGDGSEAQAKEYSDKVYATWKDISATLSRDVLFIFLLMAVFELLAYQRSSASISIGSFTLVNAPIVQIALPAIVAFVIYDGIRLTVRWLDLEVAYIELMGIWASAQSDNDLDLFIKPYLPSLWNVGLSPSANIMLRSERFIQVVNTLVSGFLIFVLPVAFESQAYYRLLQKFGYHDIFLWGSASITLLLMLFSTIYAILGWSGSA